jgi:hypothetical protein
MAVIDGAVAKIDGTLAVHALVLQGRPAAQLKGGCE